MPPRHQLVKRSTHSHGYIHGNPVSYRKYLKSNITDASVTRMKWLAGAPRLAFTLSKEDGATSSTAADEVRALYTAILRVLVSDVMKVKTCKTVKLHHFQQALKLARDWRYYR
jgi:hypothetical protein